jgi:hypothetical protein
MPFLAYIAIVVVGFSTILLELDWLTSPSAVNKPTAKIASTAVPPRALEPVAKVDGPNAALSPVFPTNPNAPRPAETAAAEPAPQPVVPAPVAPAAPVAAATAVAAPPPVAPVVAPAPQPVAQAAAPPQPVAQATPAPQPVAQAAIAPQPAAPQTAAQPAAQASANACNVQACAGTYQSFRASDCSYQPFDGGARRACVVSPDAARRAVSTPADAKVEPAAVRRLQSRVEYRRRNADDLDDADRRVRELPDVDADDNDDGAPAESRVIILRRDGPRW